MDLRMCPRCGAPLQPGAAQEIESCRFCGAAGRASATSATEEEPSLAAPTFGPDETVETLCARYIANVRAFTRGEKIDGAAPDEALMRAVEREVPVLPSAASDFRREIMNFVGALAIEGQNFKATTNARLGKAFAAALAKAVR
ncbi:MAG: hypothetical protein ACRELY_25550 [Polyangiaceae bacterium]